VSAGSPHTHAEDEPASPWVSICIVTHGRVDQLAALLAALGRQDGAPAHELLVGCDRDPAAAATAAAVAPGAVVVDTSGRTPGGGRNQLVARAGGEWLLFLDDDVVVGPGLLAGLRRAVDRWPDAGVLGGANVTPEATPPSAVVQGAVLAEPLVTGPASRRYAPSAADRRAGPWSLTSCTLAVRREAWQPFREDVRCAEETDLLAALGRRGVVMVQVPELLVGHHRRPGLVAFARQVHGYGVGRAATLRPAGLALGLAAGAGVGALVGRRPARRAVVATWAGLVAAGAVRAARRGPGIRRVPGCAAYGAVAQVAYGSGLVRGGRRRAGA
jgi:hypothetical protein